MAPSREDRDDRRQSLVLLLGIVAIVAVVLGIAGVVLGPAIVEATSSGLDLRTAALIAFGVSVVLILVMAVFAGDGLLGELPTMVVGFFAFFVIFWLMLAWIF